MRLVVAATAPLGASVLERLAVRHEVTMLLTRPDSRRGRGRRPAPSPAKEAAARRGIPVAQPEVLVQVPGDTDVIVVVAYGLLIPGELLEQRLWLNVHPSLLPRWRGAAPVERALMAGDLETGVTIHRTTAELDAGPIAAQQAFAIAPEDDAGVVYERSAEVAVALLDQVLPNPTFTPQPAEGVTYADKITSEDREIDWDAPPGETINRVRGLSPHIGARGTVDRSRLLVWKARLATGGVDGLPVGPVELLEVQPEGGRRMAAADYLRGRR